MSSMSNLWWRGICLLGRCARHDPLMTWNRNSSAAATTSFDKILIANRGEIACRVIKSCRDMGIKTVAIYSDADAQSLHVRMSDEAVRVGPPVAAQSYLNMAAVFDAIETTGAQAVHPGYGFLSENKIFAEELSKMGVAFIGPNTHAIHVMGDKLESKRTAISANVNTIPGYDGIVKDVDEALRLAKEIGYPVMLKASAGGGGKGMRIAWNENEVAEGFRLATEEAKTAVNDDRLLIEKFIDKPRHIEIQVLGDSHGNVCHPLANSFTHFHYFCLSGHTVGSEGFILMIERLIGDNAVFYDIDHSKVYLNERECSIQRRNQKVIEEAPSTFIDPETRRAMGEQAVALAKSVQYTSAGTVEFLVDSKKNFYFLEMNTRLQVEHPVTECITGVDLVREMINIAAGHPLPFTQQDIGINGWALEARVYAEDPIRFLPSIGYLSKYIEPIGRPGLEKVRVDTGIVEGSTISMYYDPMISKLITYGTTREEALKTMAKALDNYCIKGVNHNIPVLRDIITQPRFISGDITTNFIKDVYPDGFKGRKMTEKEREQLIVVASIMYICQVAADSNYINQERQMKSSYDHYQVVVVVDNEDYPVTVSRVSENEYTVIKQDDTIIKIDSDWQLGDSMMLANIEGENVTVHLDDRRGQSLTLRHYGDKQTVLVLQPEQAHLMQYIPKTTTEMQAHLLRAPMPGVVKSIACQEGDEVEEGTTIVTLEAMKMQNPLFAPMTGRIKTINVKINESVGEDDILLEFYN